MERPFLVSVNEHGAMAMLSKPVKTIHVTGP